MFIVFYGMFKVIVEEWKNINISKALISFMIPIVYLILTIPLAYVLQLYSRYERLFVKISFKETANKKVCQKHKWEIKKACNFSLYKLKVFEKKYWYRIYPEMT